MLVGLLLSPPSLNAKKVLWIKKKNYCPIDCNMSNGVMVEITPIITCTFFSNTQ